MAKKQLTEDITTQGKKIVITRSVVSPKAILSLTVAVIIAFLLLASVVRLFTKYRTLRSNIGDLQKQHEVLQEKSAQLAEKNAFLATEEGQEQLLRKKFNVVKSGEGVIVIDTQPLLPPPPKRSSIVRFWDSLMEGLGIKKR